MPVEDDQAGAWAELESLRGLAETPPVRRVLMLDPEHFETRYAINPHMRDADGALKRVDRGRARAQWTALRAALEASGLEVVTAPALAEHPDAVFCANPALPVPAAVAADGVARVVPSRMAHAERAGEVPHLVAVLEGLGYVRAELPDAGRFEGMGDGLWHPGRRLLWCGIGPRSEASAWRTLSRAFDLPVVPLRLTDRALYHLDTALALLAEDACLYVPSAFDDASRERIERLVPRRVEVDEEEARTLLAANAFCADGRRVFLQRGALRTCERLRRAGFEPVEVDTDEFLKAGGSVFCMKLAI